MLLVREAGYSIGPRMGLAAALLLVALLAALAIAPRSEAAFPGKNGLIAFDSDRAGSSDIFLMSKNGTGAFRPFGSDGAGGPADQAPAWAPEGGTLAFGSNRGGGSLDIWTVDLNGTGLKDITPYSPFDDTDPAWSHDGRLIVFETDSGGDRDIAVITSDGGKFTLLTSDPPFDEMMSGPPPITDQNPVFSQDGGRIFFQSDRNSPFVPQIFSMTVNGGAVKQLTFPPGRSVDPDISPDGSEVLFASDRLVPGDGADMYAMNLDGTNPRRLASVAGDDFRPVFSPDGFRVAFGNLAPGAFESNVFGMNLDTTGLGPLSPNPASDGNPDWQPARYDCRGEAPTIIGSPADESIVGTSREDVIVALGGADAIKALGGNDVVCGGNGRDIVNAGPGDDIVRGGSKEDRLKGKGGGDGLFGGAPSGKNQPDPDICRGGKGPDNIKGCGNANTP
jgi:dipeptidyl aminopeptidase/acylaminoacyl peptidase